MKIVFEKVTTCDKCPYFQMRDTSSEYDSTLNINIEEDQWYECGRTDKILVHMSKLEEWQQENELPYPFTIPSWCPLEDYGLFHTAIDAVHKENK